MKLLGSKTTIIGIVVIIVIVLIYFYLEGGSSAVSGGLIQGAGGGNVGSAELTLLNQIQSLRIDTALFTDPVYTSLQDHSVDIPPENVGRPNPFAPVSGVFNQPGTGTVVLPTAR